MRVVLQKVSRAAVRVAGETVGAIGEGYLLLVGIERGDGESDVAYIARKVSQLRLWPGAGRGDEQPLGARAVLAVSQFTLLGDTRKGNRPSYDRAAPAEEARVWFTQLVTRLRALGIGVETGRFQAHMEVELVNDGPVTLWLESRTSRG